MQNDNLKPVPPFVLNLSNEDENKMDSSSFTPFLKYIRISVGLSINAISLILLMAANNENIPNLNTFKISASIASAAIFLTGTINAISNFIEDITLSPKTKSIAEKISTVSSFSFGVAITYLSLVSFIFAHFSHEKNEQSGFTYLGLFSLAVSLSIFLPALYNASTTLVNQCRSCDKTKNLSSIFSNKLNSDHNTLLEKKNSQRYDNKGDSFDIKSVYI